jgi:hypothetical protein
MEVRVSTRGLLDVQREMRSCIDTLAEGRASIAHRLTTLENDWSDRAFVQMAERVHQALAAIEGQIKELWTLSQFLGVLASRVDAVAGQASHTSASVVAALRTAAPSRQTPLERVGALPTTRFESQALRLLDPRQFSIADFDWGTPQPGVDLRQPHHGREPASYAELVRAVPGVMAAAAAGVPLNASQRKVADAFIADPVRLGRHPNGTIDIIDGRHRLWAAMQLGITIPVTVDDTEIPARRKG